jgi:hypothetical protein
MTTERTDDLAAEGSPTEGGDLVGPGTGGSPTGVGTGTDPSVDRFEAASDPEVRAVVDELRRDRDEAPVEIRVDAAEAARQTGTGTDR